MTPSPKPSLRPSTAARVVTIPSRENTPITTTQQIQLQQQQQLIVTQADRRDDTLPFVAMESGQVTSTESSPTQVTVQNGIPQAIKEETVAHNGEATIDNTVTSWLKALGLAAYIDNFHEQGLYSVLQLDEFSLEDLQKMKIGNAHRGKIWKSLVEFRNQGLMTLTADSQDLQKNLSNNSTFGISSENSISQNSTYNPGFYEVTRYTFKHTISRVNRLGSTNQHARI